MCTYTGATVVTGPGAALMAGKGVARHCSRAEETEHQRRARRPGCTSRTHRSLDVAERLASGERRRRELGVRRDGDDVRAVSERAGVVTERSKLDHHALELRDHRRVVGCREREKCQSLTTPFGTGRDMNTH